MGGVEIHAVEVAGEFEGEDAVQAGPEGQGAAGGRGEIGGDVPTSTRFLGAGLEAWLANLRTAADR